MEMARRLATNCLIEFENQIKVKARAGIDWGRPQLIREMAERLRRPGEAIAKTANRVRSALANCWPINPAIEPKSHWRMDYIEAFATVVGVDVYWLLRPLKLDAETFSRLYVLASTLQFSEETASRALHNLHREFPIPGLSVLVEDVAEAIREAENRTEAVVIMNRVLLESDYWKD
jgi:hypothetical protein